MPLLRSSCVALTEFATDLTVLVPSDAKYAPRARAVLSSGGVADGVVVSEGMGYGLLLAGVALASEPRDSECWRKALSLGEELFRTILFAVFLAQVRGTRFASPRAAREPRGRDRESARAAAAAGLSGTRLGPREA